jgi:RNA ligase (TIGR02306 family)
MERKLASIQTIAEVAPIEGADKIEKVRILGWCVVVLKGDFNVGDRCVYYEIDSYLPIESRYEFLRKSSYKLIKDTGEEGFRLKTIRMRGQISQGLVMPVRHFASYDCVYFGEVGTDVTECLGVKKYEAPIPACLSGEVKGAMPSIIPKTDEIRVQSIPEILAELKGKPFYITEKMDGSSGTFYHIDGVFGVCGRNWEYREGNNSFWQLAKKHDLEKKLALVVKAYGFNIAVQGEVCGPGIQKNRIGLKTVTFYVFTIYNIDTGVRIGYYEMSNICKDLGVDMVPVLEYDTQFPEYTVDDMLEMAKGKYPSGKDREGIVIRSFEPMYSQILNGPMSFKTINNDYLGEAEKD